MSGRTLVVGGGLSGLGAALALARSGREVLVIDASDRPGGVVRSERRGGFLLEIGPNTVRSAPELWSLIDGLGLREEVVLADAKTARYIDHGGALHPLPASPAGFLRSRLLSSAGKWRLATEPFRRRGDARGESALDFFARRLGREAAERLIEPFVGGIFAGRADRLEAAAAFPAPVEWERVHGSLLRGALAARRASRARVPRGLLSFRGGLETLPRAMARALGPRWRGGARVAAIEPLGREWVVHASDGEHVGGAVVVAAPAYAAAALVSGFAPDAARALAGIPHPPLAVLHLAWPETALTHALDGFGHLVVPSPERRILGAVWSSSLFPGRSPVGTALLTVFLGGARDPAAADLSDDALVALAVRDLQREELVRGDPEPVLVTRWPRAIPQYDRGHAERLAAIASEEARRPGLRFLGNYRGGISVADVLRSAGRVEI